MKLSENLKICLENIEKINDDERKTGLCYLVIEFVEDLDYCEVMDYLNENSPFITWWTLLHPITAYWWKPGKIAPRRIWLKKHIKKLERKGL